MLFLSKPTEFPVEAVPRDMITLPPYSTPPLCLPLSLFQAPEIRGEPQVFFWWGCFLPKRLKNGVLACLDGLSRMPQTEWLPSSGRDLGSRCESVGLLARFFLQEGAFPYGRARKRSSLMSVFHLSHAFMRLSLLWLNYLPKASPPNTVTLISTDQFGKDM